MSAQCVIDRISRTITCAAGVFAPGHLGELTQFVPFDLVDAVVAECGVSQRRVRLLPSRVGVYLVLAMGLFPQLGLAGVFRRLVAGLGPLAGGVPSETALRGLRRRLGAAPFRVLFDTLAVALGRPQTAGVCYRGYRTVAFDGCSSIRVPDSPGNRAGFGRPNYRALDGGYPGLMLMALVETGTRGLLGAVFGPIDTGEVSYARMLLDRLGPGMLVLVDRGFDSNEFFAAVAGTGAHLLARVKERRCPPVLARLPDGSHLSRLGDLPVRVIDADLLVTDAAATTTRSRYRLITTLTEHRAHPAPDLVALYHERWEVESAYHALRTTLIDRLVLRSRDPAGIEQELWALLVLYQLLRHAMVEATQALTGADPDRASFTAALAAARETLTAAHGILPEPGTGHIAASVRSALLPARRARRYPRTVKYPARRYERDRRSHQAYIAPTRLTRFDTLIRPSEQPLTPPTTRRVTWTDAQHLMREHPPRPWRAIELAHALAATNPRVFSTKLAQWAKAGRFTKTGPGLYTLPDHPPLTPAPEP